MKQINLIQISKIIIFEVNFKQPAQNSQNERSRRIGKLCTLGLTILKYIIKLRGQINNCN